MPDTFLPARMRRGTWMVFILLIWLGGLSWIRPLVLPDEGRYGGVAWDMLSNGSWLTPLIDGMPYFHKPPLYYWLASLSYSVFGVTPWAARLPSCFAAVLAIVAIREVLRRTGHARLGTRAAVILATTPLFFGGAQFANMDMLVAGFITLTVLFGAAAIGLGTDVKSPWKWATTAAVSAALAVLSKGLIGIVLPGATLLVWAIWTGQARRVTRLLGIVPILAFLVVVLPWFVVMQMRFPDFFHYFFIYQQFERFAEQGFNNVQPIWFYLPVLAIGALPWSYAWLRAKRNATKLVSGEHSTQRHVSRLAWTWAIVVLVFFSIPGSKLVGYILPAMPAISVITALAWERQRAPLVNDIKRWRVLVGIAVGVCVMAVIGGTIAARPGATRLGAIMAQQSRPGDVTVSIFTYPFDLNFHARRAEPVWVVDDWNDPDVPKRDNWRKELYDAARFVPAEQGQQRLISRETLHKRLCDAPVGSRFWLWSRADDDAEDALLEQAQLMGKDSRYGLWLWTKTVSCIDPATPVKTGRVENEPPAAVALSARPLPALSTLVALADATSAALPAGAPITSTAPPTPVLPPSRTGCAQCKPREGLVPSGNVPGARGLLFLRWMLRA